ncbi:transporter [Ganoderma sinense ZZ0214-1]|uniref:Transporter n=1 Tax=Ganoderma sinense ZZ0214-1 TaxID=1077348 RepID=A0A2G8S9N2_9APHY|nr:transporter [Ganoderma sinense ZZ0214-1]
MAVDVTVQVEDHPLTQSSQQSTQPTQEALLDQSVVSAEIWGSLIPCNRANKHIQRVDFFKTQTRYTLGRSRQYDINGVSFSKCLEMSATHCSIEWDGQEASSSAIILTDLKSSNSTFINGQDVGKGKCKLLRDWNILSFAPLREHDNPKEDCRFIFRHRAARETPMDSINDFYDIAQVLGGGAFATVEKALHRAERQWYAIKSFFVERVEQSDVSRPSRRAEMVESAWKHLECEMAVLKRLRHRNICQLKETFVEPGYSISIVLEYVPGGDLNAYINKHNVLFEAEAQNITYQICEALIYIHDMGIVHRDLKPENVLLTLDSPPVVKVADFGLAKFMASLSTLHTQCGTPGFIAPEVQGSDGYDKVVDSWSLGALVFVMLTKNIPFPNGTEAAADWNLLKEFNITPDGEDFLHKLLELNPRKRMSPKDARGHEWLTAPAATERVRSIEGELSRRSLASQTPPSHAQPRRRPRPPAPSRSGAKRKASVRSLGRTMSTLSVSDTEKRPSKMPRADTDLPGAHAAGSTETVVPGLYRPTPPPRLVWPTASLDGDEIPGLGRWAGRGSSNGL